MLGLAAAVAAVTSWAVQATSRAVQVAEAKVVAGAALMAAD
jgi:hypothetical protein